MSRIQKTLVSIMAAILLIAGFTAVASPAFASWHGTCSPYHNGNLCLYTGYNGAGSKVEYPGITYGQTTSGCTNLGAGFADNIQSGYVNWTEASNVELSVTYNCGGPYCDVDLQQTGIPFAFNILDYCGSSYVNNITSFRPGFATGTP